MTARNIALKILNEVTEKNAYANIALTNEFMRQSALSEQDRRFITELVYGTLKSINTLDWMLGHFIDRRIDKIPPVIRNILRMGMYQIFFLTKVPISATCNESVNLAKKYGHAGTIKFVNAVLRNAGRNQDKIIYPDKELHPIQYCSLKYFHPEWMIKRWIERLGFEATEALCCYNNTTPPLSLRTNTLKNSREQLLVILNKEQVDCSPSHWTPEGIVCRSFPSLNKLCSLQQGLFQVQDESSMLVAHVLDPKPGEFIIDACSAPGGKSTHIAALMKNTGKIIATDVHQHKLNLINENCQRLGISIIETQCQDATMLHHQYSVAADRVLVDAPCSGMGTLRRKADSRWRKTEEMLSDLPKLQYDILHSASLCVKPGGVLIYSTCTTEPEENQEVLNHFLNNHQEFHLQTAGSFLPSLKEEKTIQLWPHIDHVDGFFIARMQYVGR